MTATRKTSPSFQEVNPSTSEYERDRYAGTRALWYKVIIRAVFDWVSYRDSDKIFQKKIAESAYNWLFGESYLFNSFENICLSLGIVPNKVREWASKLSKDEVVKIEHLDRDGERAVSPNRQLEASEDADGPEEV